jgi:hypothetical protein
VVGHHADGEGEAGWGDEDTSEWRVEEVWVAGDQVIETGDAEVDEIGILSIGIDSLNQSVVVLLELGNLDFIVIAAASL